jgi:hypothetical protein
MLAYAEARRVLEQLLAGTLSEAEIKKLSHEPRYIKVRAPGVYLIPIDVSAGCRCSVSPGRCWS